MDFKYKPTPVPDGFIKLSPSAVGKFFDYPVNWFKDEIICEEQSFTGNTASTLGTIVHAVAEAYAKGESVNTEEIEDYISSLEDDENVDTDVVRNNYREMSEVLVNQYLCDNKPTRVEEQVCFQLSDEVYAGGTYDALIEDSRNGGTLIDYKTTKTKPNTDKMPFGYYIQLMTYAYILKSLGTPISRIRIVYVVRPTKTRPARVYNVTKALDIDDWKAVENVFEIICGTISICKKNPELIPYMFKSMALLDYVDKFKENINVS